MIDKILKLASTAKIIISFLLMMFSEMVMLSMVFFGGAFCMIAILTMRHENKLYSQFKTK